MRSLPTPRAARHAELRRHSYELLAAARAHAAKKRKYDSATSRKTMSEECSKRMGFSPRAEQLDLAECMLLGLDAVCIAGTGWGKTLPFVLPLLVPQSKGKIILVISPLNALEADQAARFEKIGVRAAALNGTTYSPQMLKDIEHGTYGMVITGPKQLVDDENPVRRLFNNPRFTKKVLGFIVDEAHCISQWGGDFRPEYAALNVIRACLPPTTGVQLMSATMPPLVLAEAMKTLRVIPDKSFMLNLGNDRHNITWEVRTMAGGKTDYEALAFLVPNEDEETTCLPKTMVFFDDILVLMKARRWLLSKLPQSLRYRVKAYHSRRSELAKRLVTDDFVRGSIDIVFATEAAGMGCDISNITLVVQFMAPESLPVWIQCAGRAGRQPGLQARAILLIQRSVYMEKGKSTRKDDQPIEYVKEINEDLRLYASAPRGQCRRDVADDYFDNPPGREAPTVPCPATPPATPAPKASAAVLRSVPMQAPSTTGNTQPSIPVPIPIDPLLLSMDPPSAPSSTLDRFDPERWHDFLPTTRHEADVTVVKQRLVEWRRTMWKTHYQHQPFGSPAVLPDHVMAAIASKTTFRVTEDFRHIKWLLWKQHAVDVLAILEEVDKKRALENLESTRQKQEAAEAAKAERAHEKAEREHERLRRQAEAAQKRQDRETKARERLQEQQRRKDARERAKAEKASLSTSREGKRKAGEGLPRSSPAKKQRSDKNKENELVGSLAMAAVDAGSASGDPALATARCPPHPRPRQPPAPPPNATATTPAHCQSYDHLFR
ncbi:P-loop containing nucleoside triphosphate hydrolase protein [Trametes polyzona]|nr:P-loop containing nucleoside triphosphate hydrolase protein [Trametes polyzona]